MMRSKGSGGFVDDGGIADDSRIESGSDDDGAW